MNEHKTDRTTILVVEEDSRLREAISSAVDDPDVHVIRVPNGTQAINCLTSTPVDIVVAPIRGAGTDGAQLLSLCRKREDEVAVIFTVEPNTLETDIAVRLMQDGAYDFLAKPVHTDKLRAIVQRVRREQALSRENRTLHQQLTDETSLLGFTGKSAKMRAVNDRLMQLAASSNTTVLITGESGTGKELAARALHYHSPRRRGPFVTFNCAAFPDSLVESELFGHEKGSFTGASKRRLGRFELADGGTLVLDEVAEMDAAVQAKLLRVLETREFERLGGEKPVRVDVRIVASTNRDIAQLVAEGRFREDLYHRLRVGTVHLPPLRERVEDIPLLVRTFVDQFGAAAGRTINGITPAALRCLERYPWHGNVRELKNTIESMIVLAQSSTLDVDDLPEWIRPSPEPYAYPTLPVAATPTARVRSDPGAAEKTPIPVYVGMTLQDIEREAIRSTLESTKGNKAVAARVLNIGRRTLFRKLKEYGL
jgi:DNA-binding NtrC family response regulator